MNKNDDEDKEEDAMNGAVDIYIIFLRIQINLFIYLFKSLKSFFLDLQLLA